MTWTSDVRRAAIAALPRALQPVATFHYRRMRAQLDPELTHLVSRLRAGVRAIDVGANEGVYTHAFALSGATVEAFEPQPAYAEVLRAYAGSRSGITVHAEALGGSDGVATLHVPRRNGRLIGGHASLAPREDAERREVPVRRLDAYAFDRVAVIKIDVEGHEAEVLRGARETIARCRPTLLIEIEQRHLAVRVDDMIRAVLALGGGSEQQGYEGFFLDARGALVPVERFDASVHQRVENADTPGAPYVNNFLFRPSASTRPRDS